jgi:hypothetical protein
MKIDLTTADSALNYLRSLPADQSISLPGHYTEITTEITTEGDAVRAITEESAHIWANNHRRWEWTAAELVATLEADSRLKFHEVASAHCNVLRADFKGCRLEMDTEKTWLNIIDDESRCESCVIDADGDVISESGECVTNTWSDYDWRMVRDAIANA